MLRRFSINFALFSMGVDALVVLFSLWFASYIRPPLSKLPFILPIEVPLRMPASLYIIFPIAWVGIFAAFAIYDGRKYIHVVDEFAMLSLASLIASISLAGILYFSFREVSRALFLLFVLLAYALFLAWRALARFLFRIRKEWPDTAHRVLIVGSGPLGRKVQMQMEASGVEKMTLVGFIDDDLFGSWERREDILGGGKDIRKIVRQGRVSDVVIALPHSAYQHMSEIVMRLDDLAVRVWVALGFFDLALYNPEIEDFTGIPLLDLRAPALSDFQRLVKRAFDLILGTLFILVALPVMGGVALAIWLSDGKPVLFRQKRVGENGRLFDVYKFRTMVKNAEQLRSLVEHVDEKGDLIHKAKDDPRVTSLGRFLRRFSLDELPQLFNVLGGEMSLVGPRPELPYLVEKYHPWQRKRFAVPPGITGWWQVHGRSDKMMHLHTEDDLYYVANYSIWLDIQIMVRTAWVVLIGKGSY